MTHRLILNLHGAKAAVHADLADAAAGYLRDMAVARPGRKRVRDFLRRRRGGSGLLRVGPGSPGEAGRQGPSGGREYGASERTRNHKRT
jgi:hypothetical protein